MPELPWTGQITNLFIKFVGTNITRGIQIRKLAAIIASIALTISITSPAKAAEAWGINFNDIPSGKTLVAITESGLYQSSSTRFAMPPNEGSTDFAFICPDGSTTGKCDGNNESIGINLSWVLPRCITDSQEDCIEDLQLSDSTGALVSAKFVRQIKGTEYKTVDIEKGLYAASTVSLWDAPHAVNAAGTTTYAVLLITHGHYDRQSQTYKTTSVDASVTPYSLIYGRQFEASNLRMTVGPDGKEHVDGWGYNEQCAWAEDGVCGKIQDFAADTKVKLTARVSDQIAGWFKGRINKPTAQISKFSERNLRIAVEALPALVPRFATLVTESQLPSATLDLIKQGDRSGNSDKMLRNMPPDRAYSDGEFRAFQWIDALRENAKDTAAGVSSLWNFSTITAGQGSFCFTNATDVQGIVSTNATIYNGVAPDFENGQLTYKVAGLHYAPDGKNLNEGTYDLLMRSDLARCLYGFGTAPIQATISVIGDNGETRTAVTTVSEKDGWLKLGAYGFTFSSPTVKVKLTQKGKKTTITCVKGKVTKKVTAVGPKCPAGFKKK